MTNESMTPPPSNRPGTPDPPDSTDLAASTDQSDASGGAHSAGDPGSAPSAPHTQRLVRDPYTRLGGVASGIGHYTGLDTSIVRILFIITSFTGGLGILMYLVAWMVIPRASFWPPEARSVPLRDVSGRDLGIGLAVIGLLVAVGFGATGSSARFLVPLALVAGGVWLLVQPPAVPATIATGGPGAAQNTRPSMAERAPTGAPVPAPKRRRWVVALAVMMAGLVLAAAAIIVVLTLAFGSIGDTTQIRPTSVGSIPAVISDDVDHLEIDLSALDAADFADVSTPVQLDALLGLGSITVIIPDDISVSIDSDVGLGSISVFGNTEDGPSSAMDLTDPAGAEQVDIELRLDVDLGKITVERP